MAEFVLALDQGTTSSRAVLFDAEGLPCFQAQQEIKQSFPNPGWVEHDPEELWQSVVEVGKQAIAKAGISFREIAAIGIANQRETTILWDRTSGAAVQPAIVWQDRRTSSRCEELRQQGWSPRIRQISGLEIDPYFSATKLEWLLQKQVSQANLAFGTVDSWLVWKLTDGQVHATDVTNASRTMLFDLEQEAWSPELLELFEVNPAILPQVQPSSHLYGTTTAFGGEIPIAGIAGDQQAALFGQSCHAEGLCKCTYGTGAFLLTQAGSTRKDSTAGLLTTKTASGTYALEGSIFAAGSAVNWLISLLGLKNAAEASHLAEHAKGEEILVPAFAGMGAPHWDSMARAGFFGLTLSTHRADLARATFEGIAHQCADVLEVTQRDLAHRIAEVRVDGGLTQSDLLLQLQADLLGVPVLRSTVTETTALGAAMLAGLAVGFYESAERLSLIWRAERRFEPKFSNDERKSRRATWQQAVNQVRPSR